MPKFKKGHKKTGGRKKGTPNKATLKKRLVDELVELLNEKITITEVKDGKSQKIKETRARVFLRQAISHATRGDSQYGKIIFSYLEGLPKQDVQIDVMQEDSYEARIRRLREERGLSPLPRSTSTITLNIAPKVISQEKRQVEKNRKAVATAKLKATKVKVKKKGKSFLKGLKEPSGKGKSKSKRKR